MVSAGPESGGEYVCLATNSAGGFNYKVANLSVLGPREDDKPPSLVMFLVIGIINP